MKFEKAKILEILNKAITKHREDYDKSVEKYNTEIAEHKAKWHEEYDQEWLDFATRVRRRIRAGKEITHSIFPENQYGDKAIYQTPYQLRDPKKYIPPADLLAMKEMIEASTDEQISSSHFSIKDLMRAAAKAV
jgi:hypothetical protein